MFTASAINAVTTVVLSQYTTTCPPFQLSSHVIAATVIGTISLTVI